MTQREQDLARKEKITFKTVMQNPLHMSKDAKHESSVILPRPPSNRKHWRAGSEGLLPAGGGV